MTKVNRKEKLTNKQRRTGLNNVDLALLKTVYYEFSTYTPALDIWPTANYNKVLFPKYAKRDLKDSTIVLNTEGKKERVGVIRRRIADNLSTALRKQKMAWTFVVQLFHITEPEGDVDCESYIIELDQHFALFCIDQKKALLEAMKDALNMANTDTLVAMNTLMFPTATQDINDDVISQLVDIAIGKGVMNRWVMHERFKQHCIAHYPSICTKYIQNEDISKLGEHIKELHLSDEYRKAVIK